MYTYKDRWFARGGTTFRTQVFVTGLTKNCSRTEITGKILKEEMVVIIFIWTSGVLQVCKTLYLPVYFLAFTNDVLVVCWELGHEDLGECNTCMCNVLIVKTKAQELRQRLVQLQL